MMFMQRERRQKMYSENALNLNHKRKSSFEIASDIHSGSLRVACLRVLKTTLNFHHESSRFSN